jgi:hypothetical protein
MATGVPEAWFGKPAVLQLVRQPPKTEVTALPSTAPIHENHATGTLQEAGDQGVVLSDVIERQGKSVFVPWSSVRSLAPAGR